MELFKEINYIQNFSRISINRDTFKNNSSWLDYVEEIELRDFLNKDVNIYTHDYLDFSGSFQESIIEDYISKKKENQFMTIENYIQRFIWWNMSVLENILFSKNSHEEYNDRTTEQLELINFPKHFVSISDELIYTIEKRGVKEYHYIFLKGFENKDENFQKDYFLNLYKFLSEELPILLKEIDIKSTPEAPQEQNKNKSENVFKYSAKHYVIAYYLDCIAIGSRPISDNLKKQVEEKGVEYTSGKKSGNTFYKSYRKVMSDFDNANDKLVYLSDIFDGDWEARLIEISKQKEIIINFIKSNPFIKNL